MHKQCRPPYTEKEHERSISLRTVATLQPVCAQRGAGDMQQVLLAEECFTFLQLLIYFYIFFARRIPGSLG